MTATDTTHECPGPGCDKRIDREKLACPRHWYQVSPRTRAWVWRAYRSGDISDHVDAMKQAIAEMRA